MPSFLPGDKVILVDASTTNTLVPIGSDGTILEEMNSMYNVLFTNSNGQLMEQLVFHHQIMKDLIEPVQPKRKLSIYDDLEVI